MTTETHARPWSDLAIPPGEFLEEELAAIGMTQQDLANRSGRPIQVINEIVRGKKAITQDTAIGLERVLGIPAHLWVNLESEYQLTLARIREREDLAGQEEWLAEFPVAAMERLHWLPAARARVDKVRNLLNFFGVASFRAYEETAVIGYRITPGAKRQIATGAINAWLRKGELDGRAAVTSTYNEDSFKKAIQATRQLVVEPLTNVLAEVQDILGSAGVALLFTHPLPKSAVSGCARWLGPEKALIQLSARGLTADMLWFDFFHECCHILKHRVREVFVEGLSGAAAEEAELEADRFAAATLISPHRWAEFVGKSLYTEAAVRSFASEMQVAPGVVVGRLQREKRVVLSSPLGKLETRLEWEDQD